ncbi:beta-ketoacyl-[acyl-carrier-protein] synthase family protein [Kutzneria albida]|uniref:Ketosynthase family 3 (KS3) domain-containing protein n=1 Tax=Kutzneria albida DSM 43870 TaxID=1449976 RepID=W5WFP3_9PSEU|nr:beta-ketoacyl-[acyl-carrier-protein] synthase family protein [Kutzneria albida]AHH99627.1 hypothetical protein KALB_6267 [Kutzneria albida DSM 43870]
MRAVAVTGIGLLTPLGLGTAETWKRLLAGDSAIGPIRSYDPSPFHCQLGAEIAEFDPERFASPRLLRTTTRNDQLAIAGAVLAVEDSGVDTTAVDLDRFAVFVGGAKEISRPEDLMTASLSARREDGTADHGLLGRNARSAFSPRFYLEGLQSASLFYLSSIFGARGPSTYFHGTADASAWAVARAYRSIARGESDLAIAGGADDAVSWWSMSKMDGLGLLASNGEFRPYDVRRSGTVLGEGAAFLVLESEESARRRGAHVYATVRAASTTFDPHGLATPDPTGAPLADALRRVADPSEVDYVATHGSGTPLGDVSEARALREVFGETGYCASSVKPATGHLTAAAGALNAAVCALAVDASAVPPLLNLERVDVDCAAPWVLGQARELRVRTAVALARGLLGQQVAVVLGRAAQRSRT